MSFILFLIFISGHTYGVTYIQALSKQKTTKNKQKQKQKTTKKKKRNTKKLIIEKMSRKSEGKIIHPRKRIQK